MKLITIILLLLSTTLFAQYPDAKEVLDKIDKNMSSKNRVATSKMIIHGKRGSRTIESKSYAEGDKKSFTEYLSPAREAGTKMLKLEDKLWIFSPTTDRIIQISGHMLRQSVMGSDLSYEDMMDDRKLTDLYSAKIIASETLLERKCWIMELTAKVSDVSYATRKIWVDQERYVPLKEELYAKSGQILKKTTLSDVKKADGRWFPHKIVYKDMLKSGKGTEFIMLEIKFNQDIPDYIFTKAALKK
ncbi:MAG: outer membrane lipoprotein-sorting protein [Bacteroidetes bacterium]|nr:outer membrane lipoprotein-sorting protein [Bacteroidota bacterium]